MDGYLIFTDGGEVKLPTAISWRACHSGGEPCDSFEFLCSMPKLSNEKLDTACRFRGMRDGETVFFGIIDEVNFSLDGGGLILEVAGRGMAAALLDNQPEPLSWIMAGLEDVLKVCAYPYGISVKSRDAMPALRDYSPSASSSCWGILREFCKISCGIEPRMDRDGRLILSKESPDSRTLKIGSQISALMTKRRCGVISAIYITDEQRTIYDYDALKMGITRKKTKKTAVQAGLALSEGKRDYLTVTVTVPYAFAAFPGDTVIFDCSENEISGKYKVREAESSGDKTGELCRLTLEKGE